MDIRLIFFEEPKQVKKHRGETNHRKHITSSSFLEKLEIICVFTIVPWKLISCLCYILSTGLGRFHGLEILPIQTYEQELESQHQKLCF